MCTFNFHLVELFFKTNTRKHLFVRSAECRLLLKRHQVKKKLLFISSPTLFNLIFIKSEWQKKKGKNPNQHLLPVLTNFTQCLVGAKKYPKLYDFSFRFVVIVIVALCSGVRARHILIWKVDGSILPVCTPKYPWTEYRTTSCSWCVQSVSVR